MSMQNFLGKAKSKEKKELEKIPKQAEQLAKMVEENLKDIEELEPYIIEDDKKEELKAVLQEPLEEDFAELEQILDESIKEASSEAIEQIEQVEEEIIKEVLYTSEKEELIKIRSEIISARGEIVTAIKDVADASILNTKQHNITQTRQGQISKVLRTFNATMLVIAFLAGGVFFVGAWENKDTIVEYAKPFADFIGFAKKAGVGE